MRTEMLSKARERTGVPRASRTVRQEALSGPGERIEPETRVFMESIFGHDFSRIRVHSDPAASGSAAALGTPAYTVGDRIVVDRKLDLHSNRGLRILSHELAHVVSDRGGAAGVQCWGGKDHEKLTYEGAEGVIEDKLFVYSVASRSSLMDLRTRRLLWTGPRFLMGEHPVAAGILVGPASAVLATKGEGPEHGEDGNYSQPDEETASKANVALQTQYVHKALGHRKQARASLKAGEPVHRVGAAFTKVSEALGLAVHIAQDRGSHREGTKGLGHDDPRAKSGWDPDSPKDNAIGYRKALVNTREMFRQWVRFTSELPE